MTGQSQIWSLRTSDGENVSTLETLLTVTDNGEPLIRLGQHAGRLNTKPQSNAVKAANELQHHLATRPEVLDCYLQWKNTTAKTPINDRRLAASVGVIITALDEVLPTQWTLREMTRALEDSNNDPGIF